MVVHELITMAVHPELTTLADTPEPADECSADARQERDERDPP